MGLAQRPPSAPAGVSRAGPLSDRLFAAYAGANPLENAAPGIGGRLVNTGVKIALDPQLGPVLDFDGASHLTNQAFAPPTALPMTLAVWAKAASLPNANIRIFHVGTGVTTATVFALYQQSSTFRAQHYDGVTVFEVAFTATAGVWYRLAARFDSLSSRSLYVNGVLIGSNSSTAAALTPLTSVTLGYADWDGAEFFAGQMAAPQIWTRSLSAAEIAADYANGWQVFAGRRGPLLAPGALADLLMGQIWL
jgi:hypothetical protein